PVPVHVPQTGSSTSALALAALDSLSSVIPPSTRPRPSFSTTFANSPRPTFMLPVDVQLPVASSQISGELSEVTPSIPVPPATRTLPPGSSTAGKSSKRASFIEAVSDQLLVEG